MENNVFMIVIASSIFLVLLIMFFAYNNREIALRNKAEAQEANIENIFDKMWKAFQQMGEVADRYKDAFREIYPDLITGRYLHTDMKRESSAWNMISEDNPRFEDNVYTIMSVTIEAFRSEFANNQKTMLDIVAQHKNLINQYPSKWFIKRKNRREIVYRVISSSYARGVMKSREENEIHIFQNK